VAQRLKVTPGKLYIMDQRTKWGNCSALGNLSFNWRLIMAPPSVLRYLVTHEAVHLAIPDHSRRFWLTVRGLCADEENARRWLSRHGGRLVQQRLSVAVGLVGADGCRRRHVRRRAPELAHAHCGSVPYRLAAP
jgi:hypothetical protein